MTEMTPERIAEIVAGLPKRLWYYENGALITYPVEILTALLAEVERLRGAIRHIDNVLARRPALNGLPSRIDKIVYAISAAARAEAAEAQLTRYRAVVEAAREDWRPPGDVQIRVSRWWLEKVVNATRDALANLPKEDGDGSHDPPFVIGGSQPDGCPS